jgi:hypothetical protein
VDAIHAKRFADLSILAMLVRPFDLMSCPTGNAQVPHGATTEDWRQTHDPHLGKEMRGSILVRSFA